MTRVLFVHHTSNIGGASFCMLNIVKNLDRTKFVPIVALLETGPLVDEFNKIGVEVIFFRQMAALPYNRSLLKIDSMKSYSASLHSCNEFASLLQKHHIDIVYLNNMMLSHYLSPSKRVGCKTVLHVREHWPLDQHTFQLNWIRKIVYRDCDQLIAINRYSASIFPKLQATVVYDWIDMNDRYKPMPFNSIFGEDVSDKKVYLYIGGMSRIKGAYEVIKTFVETMKGDNYRLLVLGFNKTITNNGWKGVLRDCLYKIGVPIFEYKVKKLAQTDNRIVCIPFVYEIRDIVRQAYCELSYFTIPHANLPLAEAIILGTPVIAARTDESEEYSLDGKLACLFTMNNIDSFKNAILDFEKDSSVLKEKLNSESRVFVEKMFSEKVNADKVNSILDSLIR